MVRRLHSSICCWHGLFYKRPNGVYVHGPKRRSKLTFYHNQLDGHNLPHHFSMDLVWDKLLQNDEIEAMGNEDVRSYPNGMPASDTQHGWGWLSWPPLDTTTQKLIILMARRISWTPFLLWHFSGLVIQGLLGPWATETGSSMDLLDPRERG